MSRTRCLVSHCSYRAAMILIAGIAVRSRLDSVRASALSRAGEAGFSVVVVVVVVVFVFSGVEDLEAVTTAGSCVVIGDTAAGAFSGTARCSGICGPRAGARGSPPDEEDFCDEGDPARRLPVRPRSIRVKSLLPPVARPTALEVDFSVRCWAAKGGEYCVPASTVSRVTGAGRAGLGRLAPAGRVRRGATAEASPFAASSVDVVMLVMVEVEAVAAAAVPAGAETEDHFPTGVFEALRERDCWKKAGNEWRCRYDPLS